MTIPNLLGLIGFPLSHSFSKKYFTTKFKQEQISNFKYELFPLEQIERLPDLIKQHPNLRGFNVTIPYKQAIFPFLDIIDEEAKEIGAINTIKIEGNKLIGYNTDVFGFQESLKRFLHSIVLKKHLKPPALILGSGGASKAVAFVLKKMEIPFQIVSRTQTKGDLCYQNLTSKIIENHKLIINTTPLGMVPKVDNCPLIPYESLTAAHFLYDLIYNPEKTLFLAKGIAQNAQVCNGLEMLHLQAEKAWEIWNS